MVSHPFANGCRRWDEHHKVEFYSEKVKIVFYAVYNTVSQLGSMASAVQKRDVTKHLAETVSFMSSPLILNSIVFRTNKLIFICGSG